MSTAELIHMPISSAYLCQNCGCVGNCSTKCPACASEALMGLAGVLNRESKPDTAEEKARQIADFWA